MDTFSNVIQAEIENICLQKCGFEKIDIYKFQFTNFSFIKSDSLMVEHISLFLLISFIYTFNANILTKTMQLSIISLRERKRERERERCYLESFITYINQGKKINYFRKDIFFPFFKHIYLSKRAQQIGNLEFYSFVSR